MALQASVVRKVRRYNDPIAALSGAMGAPKPAMHTIQIRFFAALREALGTTELPLCTAAATVADLRDELIARGGAHAEALARGRAVRAALNQAMVPESAALKDGDEVAFFPPVTGG